MGENQLVKLYEYKDLLRTYLYQYNIDYNDAEDIIQEFFINMINHKSIFIKDKPNFLFLYKCMKHAALDFKKKKSTKYNVFFWYEEIKHQKKYRERLETILSTNESLTKYNNEYLQEYDKRLKYFCKFLDTPEGLILEDFYLNKTNKKVFNTEYHRRWDKARKIKKQFKLNYETWNTIREDI